MNVNSIDSIETILRESLADPEISLITGHWPDGAVMEMLPRGRARLSGARYGGAYAGLRDLHLDDSPHHMHLDLARLPCATYVFAPSVCFGFMPSFELRLTSEHCLALERFGLGLSVCTPYRGGRLHHEAVERYFGRLIDHQARFPESVTFRAGRSGGAVLAEIFPWGELSSLLEKLTGQPLPGHGNEALAEFLDALRPPADLPPA